MTYRVFQSRRVIIGGVLALAMAWMVSRAPAQTTAPAGSLDGLQFRSVEQHEVGRGPRGPVMGNWSLSFQKGKFSWHYSDVVESGTYTYDAATGTVAGKGTGGKANYKGEYDAKTGILVWNGVKYKRVS